MVVGYELGYELAQICGIPLKTKHRKVAVYEMGSSLTLKSIQILLDEMCSASFCFCFFVPAGGRGRFE